MTAVIGKTAADYDAVRLSRAVERAAVANRTPVGEAEDFARRVAAKVERWCVGKSEITARELRLQTAAALADYDPEAAYIYENEKRLF